MATEYRAEFDAEVTFLNGGGLQAQGFRLDLPSDRADSAEVGAAFVRHLGLLMVDRVEIRNLRVVAEPHKGSRDAVPPRTDAVPPRTGVVPPPAGTTRRVVDLSHPIESGMTTYPGLPGPEVGEQLSREASRSHYAEGTEFAIHRVTMIGNTGTYLDSPFHRYAGGADLAGLPLEGLVDLPAVVVHLADSSRRGVDVPALAPYDVAGRAVLLHTGWDRHWRTDRYGDPSAPFLTRAGAEWLVEHGASLVGIDSVNIDDVGDLRRPAHSTLLAAGIPIVEHLTNLGELPADGARLNAAPPAFHGLSTIPIRAYAIVPVGD